MCSTGVQGNCSSGFSRSARGHLPVTWRFVDPWTEVFPGTCPQVLITGPGGPQAITTGPPGRESSAVTDRRDPRDPGSPSRRSSRWSRARCSCCGRRDRRDLGVAPLAGAGHRRRGAADRGRAVRLLAYGTTAGVARPRGRRPAERDRQGVDGIWLAVVIGAVVTLARVLLAGRRTPVRRSSEVTDPAATYLRIAFLGTVPLLVILASTGVLRGLQDTRTRSWSRSAACTPSTSCSTWCSSTPPASASPARRSGPSPSSPAQRLRARRRPRSAAAFWRPLRPRPGIRAAGRAGVPWWCGP